jgi:Mg-chelatase subunit ChlD
MGFFDDILKKKHKPEEQKSSGQAQTQVLLKEKPKEQTQTQVQKEEVKKPLDLTKKIALNFEKLDLHKEDVRKKRLFLLDISGSMDDKIGEKRKIDHLRDVMIKYPDAKILCFSSGISKVSDTQSIPDPGGSTNLGRALKYIDGSVVEKPERIILVSDGEPDDERDALEQAKNLSLPIDIIFIGEKESKGYRFMHQLSSATGGQEFQVT